MTPAVYEIFIILALLFVNGLFAMSEMAFVAARKGRLRHLAETGEARAVVALELAESPNRFLSTVQVGITLVSILAGAFSGATVADQVARFFQQVPGVAPYSKPIGLAVVVLAVSYLSLVLGELVPKRLALSRPETISLVMAGPMKRLAHLTSPLISLLSGSTDAILRIFGLKSAAETSVSEEEVKVLLQEGLRAGVFHKAETQLVESVLALDRLTVKEIMTPRPKIIWVSKDDPHEILWHKIVVSNHTHFPVYEGTRDRVCGIVSVKDIYANLAAGVPPRIRDLMTKPLIVPSTQSVIQLLETMKQSGKHICLATDEFGSIVGLVTLNDVMEAIVGEFPSLEQRIQPAAKQREDGSLLVDAMIEIEKLERYLPQFKFSDGHHRDYQTLAGFVVKFLGHVPKEGEAFETQGWVFEVLDMDGHRVDKVLILPNPPGSRSKPGSDH